MVLNLKQIFDIVGDNKIIDYSLDLSDYELFGTKPFVSPINVKGEVFNRAGVVYLKYCVCFTLKTHCDRCYDEFERDYSFEFNQLLTADKDSENDEYIVVFNNNFDMDEQVLSDVLLNLPSKLLCSRDCKGFCQQCKVNLNHQECKCDK
ncbi:MAG: DUF177 domain-containing protein [Oscillospiraceae bacterium]